MGYSRDRNGKCGSIREYHNPSLATDLKIHAIILLRMRADGAGLSTGAAKISK